MFSEIEIQISEIENFVAGEWYTVILYFKNENRQFLRDDRIPQGHRQTVQIHQLPFTLTYDIKGWDFVLKNIYLIVRVERKDFSDEGEIQTDLNVRDECVQISSVEVNCENG